MTQEISTEKFKKVGVFLATQKVIVDNHDLPRNSPQLHHDLPSRNTTKTQKPPQKPHSTTKTFFRNAQPQNPSG